MPPRESATAPAAAPQPRTARFAAFLERRRFLTLSVFSALYFAGTVLRARGKPFWHDELYSVLLSRLDFHSLWNALSHGADATPPLCYLLLHWIRPLAGEGEIAMRVPSMLGFWAFCLCLYRFVHRRLDAPYAFAALLLPFATGAYAYAYEARCYAEVLGFCGLAMVCWQSAAEDRWRAAALPALAAALAGAAFSHYYGVVIYLPLGAAELWREWRRRAPDWGMWAAFLVGLAPVVFCLPLMRAAKQYKAHAWAKPQSSALAGFYGIQFERLILVAVIFLVLLGGWMILRRAEAEPGWEPRWIPGHEIVAAILFLTVPAFVLAAAFLVTNMFTDRYALPAVAGVVLLGVWAVARLGRGRSDIACMFLCAAVISFGFEIGHQHGRQDPLGLPLEHAALAAGPVAIDDGLLFFQAWYYLPPQSKGAVYYFADAAASDQYTGTDSIDLDFLYARPWIPFPLADYRAMTKPGSTLLIYHNAGRATWLVPRLLKDGAKVTMLRSDGVYSILRAEMR